MYAITHGGHKPTKPEFARSSLGPAPLTAWRLARIAVPGPASHQRITPKANDALARGQEALVSKLQKKDPVMGDHEMHRESRTPLIAMLWPTLDLLLAKRIEPAAAAELGKLLERQKRAMADRHWSDLQCAFLPDEHHEPIR